MTSLAPLAMSQTKDDLLKYLNMSSETYTEMAKFTDHVYRWLVSERKHLKSNCKRKPPYDWSDIVEKAKDKAMEKIAQSGDAHVKFYWGLALPTQDCPNWIARWFLYHKFRYRDGRNRTLSKADCNTSTSARRGHRVDVRSTNNDSDDSSHYLSSRTTYGHTELDAYGSTGPSTTTPYEANYQQPNTRPYTFPQTQRESPASGTRYDPIRDVNM